MTTKLLAQLDMKNRSNLVARLVSGKPIKPETFANLVEQHWWLEDLKWFATHENRSFRLRAMRVGDDKYGIQSTATHVLLRRDGSAGQIKSYITLVNAENTWQCKDRVLAALWDISNHRNKTHRNRAIDLHALMCIQAFAQADDLLPTAWEVK